LCNITQKRKLHVVHPKKIQPSSPIQAQGWGAVPQMGGDTLWDPGWQKNPDPPLPGGPQIINYCLLPIFWIRKFPELAGKEPLDGSCWNLAHNYNIIRRYTYSKFSQFRCMDPVQWGEELWILKIHLLWLQATYGPNILHELWLHIRLIMCQKSDLSEHFYVPSHHRWLRGQGKWALNLDHLGLTPKLAHIFKVLGQQSYHKMGLIQCMEVLQYEGGGGKEEKQII